MAERSVVLKLRADIGDLKGKLSEVEKAIGSVTQKQKETADAATFSSDKMADAAMEGSEAYDAIAGALLVVGGAAATGFGMAVAASMKYEAGLSEIQAATGATAKEMDKLSEAALNAGADTQYSATEAADAITQLAKAGVSTTDILAGGLTGALDLAAAGQMDVGAAAEIAATAMNQFNLEGRDVEHIADLLAAGAGKAQGEVSDMGLALAQAGLVANQTGLTIEETTAGLAAFASAGLIGSDAGTSMKTMLQRLTPQSAEAAEEMKRLGISAYDAQGNFIGLSEYAGVLQDAMRGQTEEQRNMTMHTIFGSDAVRAANVLYEQGASGILSWENKVNDAGYAAEVAAAKTDNLKGDLERLSGAWETALIRTGEGADGPLRSVVQRLDFIVSAYANAGDGAQTAARWITGTTAVIGLAGGAAMLAVPKIIAFEVALAAMGPAGARAAAGLVAVRTALLGPFGIALGAATIAVGFWANEQYKAAQYVDQMSGTLDKQTGAFTDNTREMVKNDLAMKDGWWDDESAFDSADRLGISLADVTDAASGNAEAFARVTAELDRLEDEQVIAIEGDDKQTNSIANLRAAMEGNSGAIGKAKEQTRQLAEADANLVVAEGDVGVAVAATTVVVDEQTEAISKWVEELQTIASAFVEPLSVYKGLLEEKTEAEKVAAEATAQTQNDSIDSQIQALKERADAEIAAVTTSGEEAEKQKTVIRDRRDTEVDALDKQKTSWEDYTEDVSVSLDEYATRLEEQIANQVEWEKNLTTVAGRAGVDVTKILAEMGTAGVDIVAKMATGSDEEVGRMADLLIEDAQRAETGMVTAMDTTWRVMEIIGRDGAKATAKTIAEELGLGVEEVQAIAAQYSVNLASGINPLLTAMGKPMVNVSTGMLAPKGTVGFEADGGIEDHNAQIAHAGAWRVWAEDETGGEAYIPLAPAKRPRSKDIWRETGNRLGIKYEEFAEGGFADSKYAPGYISDDIRDSRRLMMIGSGIPMMSEATAMWDGSAGISVKVGTGRTQGDFADRDLVDDNLLGRAFQEDGTGNIDVAAHRRGGYDIRETTAHEIGHLLGLGHRAGGPSIMTPFDNDRDRRSRPTALDIKNLQGLYPAVVEDAIKAITQGAAPTGVNLPKPPSTAPFRTPLSTAADAAMSSIYDAARAYAEANAVSPGGSPGSTSGLGPRAKAANDFVRSNWDFGGTIGGFSDRNIAGTNKRSKHAEGKAIDVMTNANMSLGQTIADYFAGPGRNRFAVDNVIFNRRIHNVGRGGWDRYSGVNPHTDHPHIDFYKEGGIFNPHIRDSGGPLRPGFTYNGTGRDEDTYVIPRMNTSDLTASRDRSPAASVPAGRNFSFEVKTERTWTPAEALQLIARAESMYQL